MPEEIQPAEHGTGALPDTRTELEKDRSYQHAEIAASAPVPWVEKDSTQWRSFPIRNQNGSSSCVWFATAKALGVENYLEEGEYVSLSPRDGYSTRVNKPNEGTYLPDAMKHASDFGITLEALMPSEALPEAKMNDGSDRKVSDKQVAAIFKAANYVEITHRDIETIADVVLNKKKAVVLGFRFRYDEWTSEPTIKTTSPDLGHAVTAVDACLVNGKKYIIIEDQWSVASGIQGRRMISAEFLSRCFYAAYFTDLSNSWKDLSVKPKRPKYSFMVQFDQKQNTKADVVALQDILKYEMLFPYDQQSTGVYGGLTAAGVLAFQRRYQVAPEAELVALAGLKCGPATIAALNKYYSV